MTKEEFETEFKRYVESHPDLCKTDVSTYDMLVNEYMVTCHKLGDDDKEIFNYPPTAADDNEKIIYT